MSYVASYTWKHAVVLAAVFFLKQKAVNFAKF